MPTFGINQSKTGLEAKFEQLCQQVVQELGLKLYDLDYLSGQNTLRVFIYDPETYSAVLDDCARVDKAMTPHVEDDQLDWMPSSLTLEVSSPGVYRSLKTSKHFEQSLGQRIAIILKNDLQASLLEQIPEKQRKQRKFVGTLEKASLGTIAFRGDHFDGKTIVIDIADIKKANWEPQF